MSWEAHIECGVNALAEIPQRILSFTKLIKVVVVGFSVDVAIINFFSYVAYKAKSFCNYVIKLF